MLVSRVALTLSFALSGCRTQHVVLVAAAGEVAVEGDALLIAQVGIQARVHLWRKHRALEHFNFPTFP